MKKGYFRIYFEIYKQISGISNLSPFVLFVVVLDWVPQICSTVRKRDKDV